MKHPIMFEDVDEASTEAILVDWVVAVGDRVQEGENVVEVDIDKVVVEIPAPTSGVLVETNYATDDEVPLGSVLGYIEDGA